MTALVAAEGSLAEQVASVTTYPIQRRSIEADDKAAVMERVAETLRDAYDDVTAIDGVRVSTADGWALVRPSGTQPLIRITAEAKTESTADDLLAATVDRVEAARE
ncbi:MAG: phosphomannomutase [Halonotius sp. J07HN4]|nr:MAG: phosphomannomutase [Halonotius sp. J07HN4]